MKRSQLFTKTRKDAPSDEQAKNAQLLIRAGYVHKVMAGVYAYTPLGLRVLENIKQIIREEMNKVRGGELIMSALQRPDTWQGTGRWDDEIVDVWFKTKLKDGQEVGLAWSHEEAIIEMMKQHITSYKDLPQSVYQFQTKFRNELRSKSGIMRGREFVMKDMYSVHTTQEDMDQYYDQVIEAYKCVFDRLGIGDKTFVTFASGGAFTKFSHEFQTICDAGEDTLYVNADQTIAVNEEVLEDATKEFNIDKSLLKPVVSAEVGNIFKFGTEKSEKMNFTFTDTDGKQKPLYVASYGIGVTRVMGVIAEMMSDDKGLVWHSDVAPFHVYLVSIGNITEQAEKIYNELQHAGIEVLYDDRDERPGSKFADAELMGIPYRIVVSERNSENGTVEVVTRMDGEAYMISQNDLITFMTEKLGLSK
ncbi:MAG TPA: His/Gly/Thr/Pro-type tRNA ligase C-terminal domain-containing protein [Candidatus Saccharibacteria bacterium]|jgi:prolyl-tRNA synthetase|nr:His/Gly/Thr/Pro-type tRNA ligase C-terminal domain-containing protein [Candidatus Saccharibacteria bacterium]HMT55428.1 His/Gly/Thr/Pro-type tRNA ligase C-terminal domain-containing protein [Candidatus Saccharibacteria bacterium]